MKAVVIFAVVFFAFVNCFAFSSNKYGGELVVSKEVKYTEEPNNTLTINKIILLKNKKLEKFLGRKLTIKEKIGFTILKIHKKFHPKSFDEKYSKEGKNSELFGILAIILLLIFPLASLPLAILAIVFGNKAKKINPNDKKAHTGIVLGWTTIGLLILALLAIILVITAFTYTIY